MSAEHDEEIVLPEGKRVKQLEMKRDEYKVRFDEYSNGPRVRYLSPELRRANSQHWYALSIVEALLNRGSVRMDALATELESENHGSFNAQLYYSYFEIIRLYVETGEANGKPLPALRE